MSREWKPGDVAMVDDPDSTMHGMRAMRSAGNRDRGEAWVVGAQTWLSMAFSDKSMRPLVVIDPEDREQVANFIDALTGHRSMPVLERLGVLDRITAETDAMQAALREYADPKPPKPDEPTGLGAVVEDADGHRWVRAKGADFGLHWQNSTASGNDYYGWRDIDAVAVLSEGLPDEPIADWERDLLRGQS